MLGKQSGQIDVFSHMIYEKLIPKNHLLIKIDAIIDFSFVYDITEQFYSSVGRLSYDPVLLFKICLLEYIYNLSDVKIIERSQTDIAFRWFLRLGLDDQLPDDTTISFFRCKRLGEKPFEEFFNAIVQKCIDAKIINTQRFMIDSTNVDANTNYPSAKKLVCSALRNVLKSISSVDQNVASETLARFESELTMAHEQMEKVPTTMYCSIAEKYAQELYIKFHTSFNDTDMFHRRFETLVGIINDYGSDISQKDRIISCTDPDARVAYKSPGNAKKGYKDHIIVDEKSEIILASTQTPFNVGDEKELETLIETVATNFSIKPLEISADKVYGTTDNRAYLKDTGIVCNIDFYSDENVSYEKFGVSEFDINEDLSSAICPNGCQSIQVSKGRGKKPSIHIAFDHKDCDSCQLRERCISNQSLKAKVSRRILNIPKRYDAIISGKKRKEVPEFKIAMNNRCKVERRFATMVKNHGLRRSRYLRLHGAKIHITLANIACNIIRMVKILGNNHPLFVVP